MTKDEQRSFARDLFFLGRDQQSIARVLDVSQTTMTKWAQEGNWREARAKKYSMEESRADRILTLIDYQIEALEEVTKENRRNYEDFQTFLQTETNPEEIAKQQKLNGRLKLLEKGEIDALSKLFATIKGKDISWAQYVNVTKELMEFLSERDNDLARLLVEHTDAFLMHKRDLIVS